MLCILDEFTREALAITAGRRLAVMDVIETLADLFEARSVPGYIRSGQNPSSSPRWRGGGSPNAAYVLPTSKRWGNRVGRSSPAAEMMKGPVPYL